MKLTTLDLYDLSTCPRRWFKDKPVRDDDSPARELIRRIFLTKALGREKGWTPLGIANIWDDLFWQGKDITQASMDESIRGVLAARKLYRQLPREGFKVHSALQLSTMVQSATDLGSVGDFLLSYPDRIETWVYGRRTVKEVRKSCLPAVEHYLIQKKIRGAQDRPFYLVCYYVSTNRMRPIHFRIRDDGNLATNEKQVVHLCNLARKKIDFPSAGDHCLKCKVNC